jgi:hypothetical protein
MRRAYIFFVRWFAAALTASLSCFGQATNSAAAISARPSIHGTNSAPIKQDDLEWLVGRWRVVTRRYLKKENHPMGSAWEDFMEYFNVYFPYADERMTLALTDHPEDRPITAEFVAKVVYSIGEFRERPEPMAPGGPVLIGKDRIWYGFRPFDHKEFRYSVEKRDLWLWLVLESEHVHLELIKLDEAPLGSVRDSFVVAPLKDYGDERLSELKGRYEELKRDAKVGPAEAGGANGRQPVGSETNRTSAAAASRRSP